MGVPGGRGVRRGEPFWCVRRAGCVATYCPADSHRAEYIPPRFVTQKTLSATDTLLPLPDECPDEKKPPGRTTAASARNTNAYSL